MEQQKNNYKAVEFEVYRLRVESTESDTKIFDMDTGALLHQRESSALTPEYIMRRWLCTQEALPYLTRAVCNFENALDIPPDARISAPEADATNTLFAQMDRYAAAYQRRFPPKAPVHKTATEIAKEQIEALSMSLQQEPEQYMRFLQWAGQFHQYSGRNRLLIYAQRPTAEFVGSKTFFEEKGYALETGQTQKPLWIVRPLSLTYFPRGDTLVNVKQATTAEKARIALGTLETMERTYFRPAKVYEIGQTTCPPSDYPSLLGRGVSSKEHAALYEQLKLVAGLGGFSVEEQSLDVGLLGYCARAQQQIVINKNLDDTGKLSTLCHEYAHALLHATSEAPVPIKEIEAESAAILLQHRLSLPIEDASKRYIKNALTAAKELPEFNLEKSVGCAVKEAEFVYEKLQLQAPQQKQVQAHDQVLLQVQETTQNFLKDL